MTKYADTLDIDYSLADSSHYLTSGYIMEIWAQGGNDIVTIGDTMPSDWEGYVGFGARVFGGAGNDRITGGGQCDWICGDFETTDNVTGNDTIYGGAGGDIIQGQGGSDKIFGGDGDDTLSVDATLKNMGKDKVTGGHGEDYVGLTYDHKQDVVYLNEVADSTKAAFDTINGFEAFWDQLDLRAIDADVNKDGDQAFVLTNKWTSHQAELLVKVKEEGAISKVLISGDVDGDNKADLYAEMWVGDTNPTLKILHDCFML